MAAEHRALGLGPTLADGAPLVVDADRFVDLPLLASGEAAMRRFLSNAAAAAAPALPTAPPLPVAVPVMAASGGPVAVAVPVTAAFGGWAPVPVAVPVAMRMPDR